MPPVSSSQHRVYCALPGWIFAEVVAQRAVDVRRGARPADHRLAEVADVEDADRLADGGVLLDDAGGVLQRHRPAAELRELRAEGLRGARATARCGVRRRLLMARNLPQRGRGSRAGLSCLGDDLQPPDRQPRQDPRRRGRRGHRAARQGAADRARRGGRRQGLRPQVPATAGHPRLHRQGRRDRQGADRRRHQLAAARAGRARRGGRRRHRYAGPPVPPRGRPRTPPPSRSRSPPTRPSWSGR